MSLGKTERRKFCGKHGQFKWENTEDFSAENTNTPFATDNKHSFEVSPGYSTITQPETSPANYPDTNHHRIVFPDDEEETSFPAFPQTSVPSFSPEPSPPHLFPPR